MIMRYSAFLMLAVISGLTLLLALPCAVAVQEGSTDVNIERYIEFRIEFDDGDKLHLEAEVDASPYPVSIFLMKGEEAYQDWTESEDVDIQAIMDGENVTDITVAFQVVENFSENNTYRFENSIDIGEQDTYFLIIALHRDSSMTTSEVMSRASEVQYKVDWEIIEKDVPWGLLVLAGFFLIAGVGFLTAYFISRRRYLADMENETEGRSEETRRPAPRGPIHERRRAPPMR